MILWFAGLAFVMVWSVFKDTAIDYRLVMAGALLPDVVDGSLGGPRLLHTLAASVALLVLVMLGTRGRRLLRRRMLAVPIGTFCHLVLDGMWARTTTFWWPFLGGSLDTHGLPSLQRPLALMAVQELAGLIALAWCVRRFELFAPARRRQFLRTGRLAHELV
jgi:membrane-bound metal-dependent hydrolase YbcI (DUF457 family)